MSRSLLIALLLVGINPSSDAELGTCHYIGADRRVDSRSAGPGPTDVGYVASAGQQAMALKRVNLYLAAVREGRQSVATGRYIAVETLRPTKKWLKTNLSSWIGSGMARPSMAELARLRWLMVFDTQTQQFVGSGAYAVDNLPAIGEVSRFETMSAQFVGPAGGR
jgi:hypothetical protein